MSRTIESAPADDRSTVVVTGASGYIGRRLTDRLASEGRHVVAQSRHLDAGTDGLTGHVRPAVASLLDRDQLVRAMAGADIVYHLAGAGSPSSPAAHVSHMFETNVTGTLNVLDAARVAGVRRVVFASSAAVYGDVREDPKREDMVALPASPYAISKLAAEQACGMFHRRGDVETAVLRLFNVYGPDQTGESQADKLIPRSIGSLERHEAIPLRGEGHQTRDFVFVDDVVESLTRAGDTKAAAGRIINVGTAVRVEVRRVLELLADGMNAELLLDHLPAVEGEVQHATADTRELCSVLGMTQLTAIEPGIRRVIARMKVARATA